MPSLVDVHVASTQRAAASGDMVLEIQTPAAPVDAKRTAEQRDTHRGGAKESDDGLGAYVVVFSDICLLSSSGAVSVCELVLPAEGMGRTAEAKACTTTRKGHR